MKKYFLAIVFLVFALVCYKCVTTPARKFAVALPEVLGDSTNISGPFSDAGNKVGYHVYFPTALPNGFSLNGVTVNIFSDNEVDYAVASNDNSRHFIVAESNNASSSQLTLTAAMMQAAEWNVSNAVVGGMPASLGITTPSSGGPAGHEDLIYTAKDGVTVEIFDDFGYGQLTQLAQSMQ